MRWSRVISVRLNKELAHTAYSLEVDLKPENARDERPSRRRIEREWKPLFWPDLFIKQHGDFTLEGNQLREAQLKQLKLRQSEEPPQPSPPLAPPAAPRGEDKGQLQIDELFRALEAATKAKGAHTRTDNDLIAENRRLREEVRKLKMINLIS